MRQSRRVQRIGQRGAGGRRGNSHVKQLRLIGLQANLNVAQRLAPGELREGHDPKQIGAAQRAHARIALVPFNDASKGFPRHKLHHLRKQRLAHIHAALPVVDPESIANEHHAIQIVETLKSL
jgi:hypothetical protein